MSADRKRAGLRCYAVTAPGLEGLVAAELRALGIEGRADTGGVAWTGDMNTLHRANLWLRTATRVLVRVAKFRATTFWELERRGDAIPWADLLPADAAVAFRVTSRKSRLYHSAAVAQRLTASVAKALPGARMVDAPADDAGQGVAAPGSDTHPQLVVARLDHDDLTISIDSSGAPLYQRGYRQEVGRAPLRETLAAAVLLGSGWTPDHPMFDPMCGSGVIPLEAALIACRVAPALASAGREPRAFAFTRWPRFRASDWQKCVDDARSLAQEGPQHPIAGSDRDEGAVAAASANAARAGLSEVVRFDVAPISAMPVPDGPSGWVITNPPYGVRVGDAAEIRRLYAAFGRAVRERANGWHLAMLSPDPRLDAITASEAGLRLEERLRTRNGGIPVRVVAG